MIRLLIVDDHDVVRMGLKQVFSGRVDMEVTGEARTGEEAIALVRSTPYDVALVDLSLSDMSGVDVLNRAKDPSQFRRTHIAELPLYLCFAKTPKARALMALFDRRMDQLVKNGQLKPIFERWKQPYPFDSN